MARDPAGIGSVAPSGSALAKLMTRDIPAKARVLELGPGSGSVTEFILKRLDHPSRLTLIEADHEMHGICSSKFPGVTVQHGDVEDFLCADHMTYDFIISGIPFAAMDKAKRGRVFILIRDHLADGGAYIMFQYSTTTQGELKCIFGSVKTAFTPLNIPPAFVFTCKK